MAGKRESGDVLTAIRDLSEKFGGTDSRLRHLEQYIKSKTDSCNTNYEDLKAIFSEVKDKITAGEIGSEVEKEVKGDLRRRSVDRRKSILSFATLASVVVTTAVAVLGIHTAMDNDKKTKYTRADADKDNTELLKQINQARSDQAEMFKKINALIKEGN